MRKDKFVDTLQIAWTIAWKDIQDALKNKNTRTNILIVMGLVVFFYWGSTPRPFDKRIDVAYYDEGNSSLRTNTAKMTDGYQFRFYETSSVYDLEGNLGWKQLGVVIPADFDQSLEQGREAELTGYILWVFRSRVAELENKYSQKFSELLGKPVRVTIGENIVIPRPETETTDMNTHILFVVFLIAVMVVPILMMEEKQTKTMDALLISPASIEQVILGKALAGLFYILVCVGLVLVLNWTWFTSWGLALVGFTSSALLAIGLGLLIGTLADQPQKVTLWAMPVLLIALLPTQLLQMEDVLSAGVINAMSWIPTVGLVKVLRFSLSSGAPLLQILSNLGLALICTALVYGAIVWKVRRSDR